ncbi:hypothetical protein [Amylibacter sp. IMCC11727]|uniref:hypothetical protein n=1 Tax=Amylibacter sp. IMCC11727 TaxID=3039851 RepID=UPI00244DA3A7|nr:hypothetical protein [Amylibacter sp. IMCC11727]WGI22363.1 hypothetical protein QBD29_02800 [Amylibacter sp. IMCC11727]
MSCPLGRPTCWSCVLPMAEDGVLISIKPPDPPSPDAPDPHVRHAKRQAGFGVHLTPALATAPRHLGNPAQTALHHAVRNPRHKRRNHKP